MKVIFYNETGIPVMEVYEDTRYQFNNPPTKAFDKGATSAKLFDSTGKQIDIIYYHPIKA